MVEISNLLYIAFPYSTDKVLTHYNKTILKHYILRYRWDRITDKVITYKTMYSM